MLPSGNYNWFYRTLLQTENLPVNKAQSAPGEGIFRKTPDSPPVSSKTAIIPAVRRSSSPLSRPAGSGTLSPDPAGSAFPPAGKNPEIHQSGFAPQFDEKALIPLKNRHDSSIPATIFLPGPKEGRNPLSIRRRPHSVPASSAFPVRLARADLSCRPSRRAFRHAPGRQPQTVFNFPFSRMRTGALSGPPGQTSREARCLSPELTRFGPFQRIFAGCPARKRKTNRFSPRGYRGICGALSHSGGRPVPKRKNNTVRKYFS